ncbi:MAG: GHKL domain-containing protein, partial [Chitinophagaceae bacterium]|nr:GHKL domain-containing protein [Chitinophagaceae bacterium]
DINALCDEYLRLSYHGLRAKDKSFNAEFDTQFDTTLAPINVVPQDIGRVILNLINNAFYAVNERQKKDKDSGYKPRVTLTTRQEGNQVVIEVADNGTGMPDQVKEKIFQPFFTTKPTGEGTGLGLSLSYDIVTKGHGGGINVSTKANHGTVITIQLPS